MKTETKETVKDLWAKAKEGDRGAWTVLYLRYQEPNLANAMRITHNREDAEEVVQEAWLKAWEKRASIQEIGGFLCQRITALALNVVRTRKRQRIAFSYPIQGE